MWCIQTQKKILLDQNTHAQNMNTATGQRTIEAQQQQFLTNNFNMLDTVQSPVGAASSSSIQSTNVQQMQDLSMHQQNTWSCHLHSSSSAECSMRLIGDVYYHLVPVKTVSRDAQQYNMQNIPNEYWEIFYSDLFISPVGYTSHINDYNFFYRILSIFQLLDVYRLKYIAQNTPSDFIKRHIVCTATGSRVNLCNKHLLKSVGTSSALNNGSNGAVSAGSNASATASSTSNNPTSVVGATKVYSFYTRCTWVRSLLKALFPRIEVTKDGVSTTIPMWAINLYHKPRANQCIEIGPYENNILINGGVSNSSSSTGGISNNNRLL